MDYSKFIVSDQKEDFISIQWVNTALLSGLESVEIPISWFLMKPAAL